jgi:hypothetical protein
MRESDIEDYLVEQVAKRRGEQRKVKWINRHGAPDRLVWIPGWSYPKMPELKAPGLPLKEHQKREHKRLKKMGIYCCKLDTFTDVDRFLRTK